MILKQRSILPGFGLSMGFTLMYLSLIVLIPIAALWGGGSYELLNARYARVVFGVLYVAMLGIDYISLTQFIVPQLAR